MPTRFPSHNARATRTVSFARQWSNVGMRFVTRHRYMAILALFLLVTAFGAARQVTTAQTIPTIAIVSVVAGESVTIETGNFPAAQTFTARMGLMGSRGEGGIVVGTTDSGAGGTFQATYDIPADLANVSPIAIRLESAAGYFSYAWFYNRTAVSPPTAPTATPTAAAPPATPTAAPTSTPVAGQTIPTFSIIGVTRNESVMIETADFPANQTFTVRMGPMGTQGINGIVVDSTNSGAGGTFQASYEIPDSLHNRHQISIRLESASGYYSYNWFFNVTTNN